MNTQTVDRFLSAIERAELRSLTWGYADGSLTYDQLSDLFVASGCGPREEVDRIVDLMVERSLVLEGWTGGMARYRSRFAETVRLLVHLRQVTESKPWDVAPDLVSDYRVVTSPRRVPKRVHGAEEIVAAWSATRRWDEQRERATRMYLEATGSRLSKFQVDVGRSVFDADDRDAGVVVTAGTGAGKTLAYYLPVAIEVAQLITATTYWTKSISLYPRVELLKDQMSDVFRIVSKVPTPGSKNRPIRLGALLEPVPNSTEDVAKKWRGTKSGFLCPFLRCPGCEGELYWTAG